VSAVISTDAVRTVDLSRPDGQLCDIIFEIFDEIFPVKEPRPDDEAL
jgi:hypothetical protein